MKEKIDGSDILLVAVEPTACPTSPGGVYEYDYGDTAGMAPIVLMYTLGHEFVPPPSMPEASGIMGPLRSSASWSRRASWRPGPITGGDLRCGGDLRPDRGHRASTGDRTCNQGGHRRGGEVPGERRVQVHLRISPATACSTSPPTTIPQRQTERRVDRPQDPRKARGGRKAPFPSPRQCRDSQPDPGRIMVSASSAIMGT